MGERKVAVLERLSKVLDASYVDAVLKEGRNARARFTVLLENARESFPKAGLVLQAPLTLKDRVQTRLNESALKQDIDDLVAEKRGLFLAALDARRSSLV